MMLFQPRVQDKTPHFSALKRYAKLAASKMLSHWEE